MTCLHASMDFSLSLFLCRHLGVNSDRPSFLPVKHCTFSRSLEMHTGLYQYTYQCCLFDSARARANTRETEREILSTDNSSLKNEKREKEKNHLAVTAAKYEHVIGTERNARRRLLLSYIEQTSTDG